MASSVINLVPRAFPFAFGKSPGNVSKGKAISNGNALGTKLKTISKGNALGTRLLYDL